MAGTDAIAPLLLGPRNAVAATGLEWRTVRAEASRLGVERVRVGRAWLVPAAPFLAALERDTKPADAAAPVIDLRGELARRMGTR